MSFTLATVADALIEFILSLLRDPDAAREFQDDPEHALAARGLQHVSPADVAAVAPIVIERTHVVQVAAPQPQHVERHQSQVVNEIKQVTSHFQWVDDRDTIVDQSVNQNIWAQGDVTQTFDNQANVASGDEAVAAGGDATVDKTWDHSTTIEAGDDVNIGNGTDVQVVEDSSNEQTDASTATDASTTVVIDDSANEQSDSSDHSGHGAADGGASADLSQQDATAGGTAPADAATGAAPSDPAQSDAAQSDVDATAVPVDHPAEPAEPADSDFDSAAQYVDVDVADADGGAFTGIDAMSADESADDDNF